MLVRLGWHGLARAGTGWLGWCMLVRLGWHGLARAGTGCPGLDLHEKFLSVK